MRNFILLIMFVAWMPFGASGQMSKELHTTAMECWELKDYACAEIYLRDLIKLESDPEWLVDYCLKLGTILSQPGDSKEAFKLFKMAIKMNPQSTEAYVKRGELYSSEGNNKKALADFEKALEIDPGYAPALSHKAELLVEYTH
ncbi:MAG: tetratricopeptide repeat protein [Bacteroidales bacterium]|nr:tetratricopeptide repeat protein [Bacteroidales bacterium]